MHTKDAGLWLVWCELEVESDAGTLVIGVISRCF